MQTVMIYDQLDAELKFFVLDGDYTRFNNIYVNQCISETKAEQKKADAVQQDLCNLLYDQDFGKFLLEPLTTFPVEAVRAGATVIVAGFLP